MATYRLLVDHYVGGRYLEAGTIVTEGVDVPVGWVPSLSVDPLDGDAALKFWNQGPGILLEGAFAWPGGSRFADTQKPRPATYWQDIDRDTSVLTGIGASLGPRVKRPIFTPPPPLTGDGVLDFSNPDNSGLWALLEDI